MKKETIFVTSPDPGAGKTTIAINLATVLKLLGKRVLIVDTNTTNPRLDAVLDAKNGKGKYYQDIIDGTEISEAIKSSKSGLDFIPSKKTQPVDNGTLNDAFELISLSADYDFVIFDTDSESIELAASEKIRHNPLIVVGPQSFQHSNTIALERMFVKIPVMQDIVLNKVQEKSHMLLEMETRMVFRSKLISIVPEAGGVNKAFWAKMPSYSSRTVDPFSTQIMKIAEYYLNDGKRKEQKSEKTRQSYYGGSI